MAFELLPQEKDPQMNIYSDSLIQTPKAPLPEDAVLGDYNGDGIQEYMWLEEPLLNADETSCIHTCHSYLRFSNPDIPFIEVKNCISGIPVNLGDLNTNNTDEIGLSPMWFTSCWTVYYVWTFVNGEWIYAVKPFDTHCSQWEDGVVPIEIDQKKKGRVIIRTSGWTKHFSDIVVREKSVKIAK